LESNPGLEAKTLFEHLQRSYPGRFADGQIRTLQRGVKRWRALSGPSKEVFFPQEHRPGERSQSDFTDMSSLGVTILGQPFDHLVYHFVLTYSNWEAESICFSESFESLSEGLQNALWELGGVPMSHQTDCLGAAVLRHGDGFQSRYDGLLHHYGLEGRRTQPASPNENGDIEQRHSRFRRAVDQALMLRGHRDFEHREAYASFLRRVRDQLNAGRRARVVEELAVLHRLPAQRLEACKRLQVRVRTSSTIRVAENTYSVHSRLMGEEVEVRLQAECLDVFYGQRRVERIPRLRGKGGHSICYRHVIDWLVRKPGAFANYRYRDDLFPSSRFRMAYDALCVQHERQKADREYLAILYLAATESEVLVETVLSDLFDDADALSADRVKELVQTGQTSGIPVPVVTVPSVDLALYDSLLPSHQASLQEVV
jgi:hypothetical protein